MLQVKDVVKIYRTGDLEFTALRKISLEISQGEFTAIMGPSGSGKSTFMNIIGCLDRMDSGSYFLNNKDVSKLTDKELAFLRNKELGFVFQSFNLIPRMSILENVELPMLYSGISARQRRERAENALEKVGLTDRMRHMPNEISGGQKQRAAIARAVVNEPALIMADEPTGNLDSRSSADIMKIFEDLNNEGATILMVTHEKDIAQHTKRIVSFRDGEIVSDLDVIERTILGGAVNESN